MEKVLLQYPFVCVGSQAEQAFRTLVQKAWAFNVFDVDDPKASNDPYKFAYGTLWVRTHKNYDGTMSDRVDFTVIANHASVMLVQFSGEIGKRLVSFLDQLQARFDFADSVCGFILGDSLHRLSMRKDVDLMDAGNYSDLDLVTVSPNDPYSARTWAMVDDVYALMGKANHAELTADYTQLLACLDVAKAFSASGPMVVNLARTKRRSYAVHMVTTDCGVHITSGNDWVHCDMLLSSMAMLG